MDKGIKLRKKKGSTAFVGKGEGKKGFDCDDLNPKQRN